MDTATHTLFGAALATTRLGRVSPGAVPALLIAANLPDMEVIFHLGSDTVDELISHRGSWHSILGVLGLTLGFTVVVRAFERLTRRKIPERSFLKLMGVLFLGVASHLAWDYANTYGVRLWYPFSDTRVFGDLVYIVDPWIWLILWSWIHLGSPRNLVCRLISFAIVAAQGGVVFLSGRADSTIQIAWSLGVALVLGFSFASRSRLLSSDRVALVSSITLALHLAQLAVAGSLAHREGLEVISTALPDNEIVLQSMRSPHPGKPYQWSVIAETEHAIYFWHTMNGSRPPYRHPHGRDGADVRALQGTREYQAWMTFARYPWAQVVEGRAYLMDARYQSSVGTTWCTIVVSLDRD